jgi:spermidine synthase
MFEPMYDFIFVDHYTFEEEEFHLLEELAGSLKKLLRPEGSMVFWIDENSPELDKEFIRDLWVSN